MPSPVAHRNEHVVTGLNVDVALGVALIEDDVARLERQLATIRHGVTGVDRKVHQCGAELAGIDKSRADVGPQTRFYLDALAQRRA